MYKKIGLIFLLNISTISLYSMEQSIFTDTLEELNQSSNHLSDEQVRFLLKEMKDLYQSPQKEQLEKIAQRIADMLPEILFGKFQDCLKDFPKELQHLITSRSLLVQKAVDMLIRRHPDIWTHLHTSKFSSLQADDNNNKAFTIIHSEQNKLKIFNTRTKICIAAFSAPEGTEISKFLLNKDNELIIYLDDQIVVYKLSPLLKWYKHLTLEDAAKLLQHAELFINFTEQLSHDPNNNSAQ